MLCVVDVMEHRHGAGVKLGGLLADRSWLYEQYITKDRSAGSIARELRCTPSSVWYRLRQFDIPRRPRGWQPSGCRIDEDGRECSSCGVYKEWSQFWRSRRISGRGSAHMSKCIDCVDPDAARANNRAHKLRRHGLTEEKLACLIELDGDVCALCGGPQQVEGCDLDIDHDHSCCPGPFASCGKCVRGRLCRGCNRLVGRIEAAGFTLDQLVAYLMRRPFAEEGSLSP
jgi:Recombination endonuclease VII